MSFIRGALFLLIAGSWWDLSLINAQEQPEKESPPSQSAAPAAAPSPFPENFGSDLTNNRPVSASSEDSAGNYPATAANDGDPYSQWEASESGEAWWQINFKVEMSFRGVAILWDREAAFRYRVEGARDGIRWTTLVDAAENREISQLNFHEIEAEKTQYIRVTVISSFPEKKAAIREFIAYSDLALVPENVRNFPKKGLAKIPKKPRKPEPPPIESDGTSTLHHTKLFRGGKGDFVRTVRVPKGFSAQAFAKPPMVDSPVSIAAAGVGDLFVGMDRNSALGSAPHQGQVRRLIDSDGDGIADESHPFIREIDSPRGIVWDGQWLYVVHPPFLSRFRDLDGDHIADESERLIENLQSSFSKQAAAHRGAQGLSLGMDGWLYVSVGDQGVSAARGRDGVECELRSGGVLRVRPDGSTLQVYGRGLGDLYGMAISPESELFGRGNSSQKGQWRVQLHHVIEMGHHGYPHLFSDFPEEARSSLAEYEDGAGSGALWLEAASYPGNFRSCLLTADWRRNQVYRHELVKKNAGFKELAQYDFVAIPKPTALASDLSGRLYVASWKGGQLGKVEDPVGWIAAVLPPDFEEKKERLDWDSLGVKKLISLLNDPNLNKRLLAQRELLRRDVTTPIVRSVAALLRDPATSHEGQCTAVFTLAQLDHPVARVLVRGLTKSRNSVLRALAYRSVGEMAALRDELVEADELAMYQALAYEKNARVLREGIVAISKRKLYDEVVLNALFRWASSNEDPLVSHLAAIALSRLEISQHCFEILEDPEATKRWPIAFRILSGDHRIDVVSELIQQYHASKKPAFRNEAITALARLYHREKDLGKNEQGEAWNRRVGNRGDSLGPYFYPETWEGSRLIDQVFHTALQSRRIDKSFLLFEMGRNRIPPRDHDLLVDFASDNRALEGPVVEFLRRRPQLSEEMIGFLNDICKSKSRDEGLRSRAAETLAKSGNANAAEAALLFYLGSAKMSLARSARPDLQAAIVSSPIIHSELEPLIAQAGGGQEEVGRLAWALLLMAETRDNLSDKEKDKIRFAVSTTSSRGEAQWKRLLDSIREGRFTSQKAAVEKALKSTSEAIRKSAWESAKAIRLLPRNAKFPKPEPPAQSVEE